MGDKVVEEEVVAALKDSRVFSALKPDELSAVAGVSKIQHFGPSQFIVNEGDKATAFYLILDGLVEVRRANRPVGRLGRGQFFGETILMGDMTRSTDVFSVRETRCMVLSGADLRSYPAVALKLLGESTAHDQAVAPRTAPESEPVSAGDDAVEFESDKTKLLFNALVKSFTEDYMVRRLYFEQAGWMTFGELAKATSISRTSLYGKHGNFGQTTSELLARGLIETRVFTGQRGKGGEALKVRIAYDKEPVKRYVDKAVLRRQANRQPR